MAILEVEHIKKKFGKTDVLKDISFSLEQGEVLSIIGSSGSGISTLEFTALYNRGCSEGLTTINFLAEK